MIMMLIDILLFSDNILKLNENEVKLITNWQTEWLQVVKGQEKVPDTC